MKRLGFAVLLVSLTTSAYSIDFKNRLSIGGTYAVTDPVWRTDFDKDYTTDTGFGGYLGYGLGNNLTLLASYSDLMTEERGLERNLRFRPMTLSLRFNMAPKWVLNPYLRAGGGVSRNTKEIAGSPNIEWTKMVGQGGAGFEIFLTPSTSLGFEALYHQIVAENHQDDYGLATYGGTVNIYFGESKETREAKAQAEQAKADAERLAREKADAEAKAKLAQDQSQQQLTAAQLAAAEAAGRTQSAQAELDKIKEMIRSRSANPIKFETGKAVLLADSYPTLKLVADAVRKYPDLKLRVEGHTDTVGSDELNLNLSQKRAEAVRDFLVEKEGLPADQLAAVGLGERQPIETNDTADGRAQNRRVEFLYTLK